MINTPESVFWLEENLFPLGLLSCRLLCAFIRLLLACSGCIWRRKTQRLSHKKKDQKGKAEKCKHHMEFGALKCSENPVKRVRQVFCCATRKTTKEKFPWNRSNQRVSWNITYDLISAERCCEWIIHEINYKSNNHLLIHLWIAIKIRFAPNFIVALVFDSPAPNNKKKSTP